MFKHNDRCLPKVRDDEPIFVLRGQDELAPYLVNLWAFQAKKLGLTDERIQEARDIARAMECYPLRRRPD